MQCSCPCCVDTIIASSIGMPVIALTRGQKIPSTHVWDGKGPSVNVQYRLDGQPSS